MEDGRRREVYLDCAASTPCDPRVVEAMMPFLLHEFANPSSPHRAGTRSSAAIEVAREKLAEAMGCVPGELVFTSGATESNNLALMGSAGANTSGRHKIVTTAIEHKSVLRPCDLLAQKGYELALCPVRSDGRIELGALADLLDEKTFLVSVQAANNEIGTIQPIREVAQLAHRVGAIVHCDAAQSFGKIPVNLDDLDMVSLSAHKCYGPKGVGALFVKGGIRSAAMVPIFSGGGQEGDLRSGTPNVPGIVGFGECARLARTQLATDAARVANLRDRLEEGLCTELSGLQRNGALERRLPSISSLTFPGVDAEAIIANAPELALSSSSACHSGAPEPSHVLQAIGLSRADAYSTIRIGVGRFNGHWEMDHAAERIAGIVRRLRAIGTSKVDANDIAATARSLG